MNLTHRQLAEVQLWSERQPGALDLVLVDARSADAFARGHIAGALSVPLDDVARLAGQLPRGKELVTYCWRRT